MSTNLASVFSEEDRRYLENFLRRLERDTSAEVVVVTVPSLDGRTVEEYANGLFAAWGIGKERDDNGVLLLVAPSDRRVRIEVGYGLEPILPDGLAGEIIRDDILPEFRAGNVPRGIGRGLDRISRLIRGDVTATTRREPSPGRGDSGLPFIFFFIVPGVVGLAALTLTFGRRRRAGDNSRDEARNAGGDTSSSLEWIIGQRRIRLVLGRLRRRLLGRRRRQRILVIPFTQPLRCTRCPGWNDSGPHRTRPARGSTRRSRRSAPAPRPGTGFWYVFPQLSGLGASAMSQAYAIADAAEAEAYLRDPTLRARLLTITAAVAEQLTSRGRSLSTLLGSEIDARKLVSSLTLFEHAALTLQRTDGLDDYAALAAAAGAVLTAAAAEGYARCPSHPRTPRRGAIMTAPGTRRRSAPRPASW